MDNSPGFLVYAADMQKLTTAVEYCGISLENHRIKKQGKNKTDASPWHMPH